MVATQSPSRGADLLPHCSHIISVCLKHDRSIALGSAVPWLQALRHERALLENYLSAEAREGMGCKRGMYYKKYLLAYWENVLGLP